MHAVIKNYQDFNEFTIQNSTIWSVTVYWLTELIKLKPLNKMKTWSSLMFIYISFYLINLIIYYRSFTLFIRSLSRLLNFFFLKVHLAVWHTSIHK